MLKWVSQKIGLTPKYRWSGTYSVLYFEPANHLPALQNLSKPHTAWQFSKHGSPGKSPVVFLGNIQCLLNWVHFFEPAMLAMLVYHRLVSMVLFLAHLRDTSTPRLRVAALAPKMSRCKRCNGNSDSWWKVCCHAPAVAVALRTMLKNLKFLANKIMEDREKIWKSPLFKTKNALETFSLSVYMCLAFARKYGTLQRS